jgi:RNA polymerase sigma factor for flagellar operon FliA
MQRALEGLPDQERFLIRGHYLEGRNFDELAAELGLSKSWASRLHTRALGRMRELLGE